MKKSDIRQTVALALLFACQYAKAEDDVCGSRTMFDGTVFSLAIETASDGNVEFKLCARREPEQGFLLVTTDRSRTGEASEVRKIALEPKTYQAIVARYEGALEYNVRDSTLGVDGSSWCLETQRGSTYSKACFWSPGYDAEERGLVGLWRLGEELWRISAVGPKVGRLY